MNRSDKSDTECSDCEHDRNSRSRRKNTCRKSHSFASPYINRHTNNEACTTDSNFCAAKKCQKGSQQKKKKKKKKKKSKSKSVSRQRYCKINGSRKGTTISRSVKNFKTCDKRRRKERGDDKCSQQGPNEVAIKRGRVMRYVGY